MLVVVAVLLAGYLTAGTYGLSWDEPDNSAFGRQALQAYASLKAPTEWQSNLESKGPFFVALAELLTPVLATLHPSWTTDQARHFIYFLTLPLAASALYWLARRMVPPLAALSAAGLFLTQPLFFGHAFINPKDTPFMAFFVVSVALGVAMIGSLQRGQARRAQSIAAILAAGVALGLATAIRVFGPFAGVLITILAVWRLRRIAAVPLGLYWLAAAATTYLAWPFLWGDPIGRFTASLTTLVNFPWGNLVLYRGLVYNVKDLPWHYLPFTTVIQITEPALVLAVVGGCVGLLAMVKDPARRALYSVLFLWTAVPYAASILTHAEVYDNSRQFLFAQPPLFLAAGLALEALFSRIRWLSLKVVVLALAAAPGMVSIVRLHPYEYIYYNQLVGGVRGAFRQYELDYWATSYRAAMEDLNRIAPPGAAVEVVGPWLSAATFARTDLRVFKAGSESSLSARPDYIMVLTRSNMDERSGATGGTILQVEVSGATLAVVRAVGEGP